MPGNGKLQWSCFSGGFKLLLRAMSHARRPRGVNLSEPEPFYSAPYAKVVVDMKLPDKRAACGVMVQSVHGIIAELQLIK